MSAVLRVVRGEPTDEELAALLAVLTARDSAARARAAEASAAGVRTPTGRTAWNDPARQVRRPMRAGPGGWRRSALP